MRTEFLWHFIFTLNAYWTPFTSGSGRGQWLRIRRPFHQFLWRQKLAIFHKKSGSSPSVIVASKTGILNPVFSNPDQVFYLHKPNQIINTVL